MKSQCGIAWWIFILVGATSCNAYNFAEPQPVDAPNLTEVPEELRGVWLPIDSNYSFEIDMTIPLEDPSQNLFTYASFQNREGNYAPPANKRMAKEDNAGRRIYVRKHSISQVQKQVQKVIKDAYPKLIDGEFVHTPEGTTSFWKVHYDMNNSPCDTTENFLVKNNLIYEIGEDNKLGIGCPFSTEEDTLYMVKTETTNLDLGGNAMFRKIDNNTYVLNVNNSILGENNNWWSMVVIEKRKDSVVAWLHGENSCLLPSMIHHVVSDNTDFGNVFYFNCKWRAKEMQQMLRNNVFTFSSFYYKQKK